MTKLSRRAGGLSESLTLAVTAKAKALKAAGERVIGFGAGEPDFDTPEHIREAAHRALDSGSVAGYTAVAGTMELREAAAASFRDSGVDAQATGVVASVGAKQALFNALAVLLDDGDEAILPAPYWVSYPAMIHASGGNAVVVDTRDEGCILTPEKLEAALTERTRVLVSVSPSNPTGVTHSREHLAALGDVLRKYPNVTVVSDEIYQYLVYEGTEFVPFAVACPDIADRIVTVRGVSKSFAMTGWRIGYATGPGDVIKAMTRYQSHTTSNPTTIAQAAAVAALTGPMEPIEAMRQAFDKRRKLMVARLEAIDGFSLVPPTGAFYCFPDIAPVLRGRTPLEFAEGLLEQAKVALVPGEAFGAESNIRLSYACAEADIEEGCDRLARFVAG
ncbi:MAG: pyridoxal phosphate-dependent aminotransferase [Planctomycetota bacterium]|jgi:aspartate aminotransferase